MVYSEQNQVYPHKKHGISAQKTVYLRTIKKIKNNLK